MAAEGRLGRSRFKNALAALTSASTNATSAHTIENTGEVRPTVLANHLPVTNGHTRTGVQPRRRSAEVLKFALAGFSSKSECVLQNRTDELSITNVSNSFKSVSLNPHYSPDGAECLQPCVNPCDTHEIVPDSVEESSFQNGSGERFNNHRIIKKIATNGYDSMMDSDLFTSDSPGTASERSFNDFIEKKSPVQLKNHKLDYSEESRVIDIRSYRGKGEALISSAVSSTPGYYSRGDCLEAIGKESESPSNGSTGSPVKNTDLSSELFFRDEELRRPEKFTSSSISKAYTKDLDRLLVKSSAREEQVYYYGDHYPLKGENLELWDYGSFKSRKQALLNTVCGMLNTHIYGMIVVGVSDMGVITGMPLNRENRDRLRLDLGDVFYKQIKPLVDSFEIKFLPVQYGHEPNLHVMEIHFSPSSFDLYTLSGGKCFIRKGRATYEVLKRDVLSIAMDHAQIMFQDALEARRSEVRLKEEKLRKLNSS